MASSAHKENKGPLFRAVNLLGFILASVLLWFCSYPLVQNIASVASGVGMPDAALVSKTILGTFLLVSSTTAIVSSRMRLGLARLFVRDGREDVLQGVRYLNLFSRDSIPLMVLVVLGAALVGSASEMMAGWVRISQDGLREWAAGVHPIPTGTLGFWTTAFCAVVVALSCAIVRARHYAFGAMAIGIASACGIELSPFGPYVASVAMMFLLALHILGVSGVEGKDDCNAVRSIFHIALAPPLATVSSVIENSLQALFTHGSWGVTSPFFLLVAMNAGALISLLLIGCNSRFYDDDVSLSSGDECVVSLTFGAKGMSERERAVLLGSLQGKSLSVLSKELGLSRSTVGTYRLRAYSKIGVSSLEEARSVLCDSGLGMGGVTSLASADSRGTPAPVCLAVKMAIDRLGWAAWFFLTGFMLLPWNGSRAWLLDEAWSAMPVALLVVGSGYAMHSGAKSPHNIGFVETLLASLCASLLAISSVVLPGARLVCEAFPTAFDIALALLLIAGIRCMSRQTEISNIELLECSAISAAASFASSFLPLLHVFIFVAACFVLMLRIVWQSWLNGRGKQPEGETCAPSKHMPSFADYVGFMPHGTQAVRMIIGFSALGWGLYQSGQDVLIGSSGVYGISPSLIACSVFLYACLGCLCLRWLVGSERNDRGWIAALVPTTIFLAVAFFFAVGSRSVASPLGHLLLQFPAILILGSIFCTVRDVQAQYGCKSFGFMAPTASICILSLWLIGPSASLQTGEAAQFTDFVAVVACFGGLIGSIALGDALNTLRKRLMIQSAGMDILEGALKSEGLSESEARVAALFCIGKNAREISSELYVEISTVRSHTRAIYAKLAVHSRAELEVVVSALVRERIK